MVRFHRRRIFSQYDEKPERVAIKFTLHKFKTNLIRSLKRIWESFIFEVEREFSDVHQSGANSYIDFYLRKTYPSLHYRHYELCDSNAESCRVTDFYFAANADNKKAILTELKRNDFILWNNEPLIRFFSSLMRLTSQIAQL